MSDMSPARWYAPPVDRTEVRKLMERTNGRAAGSYLLWLLLLVGLGWVSGWLFELGSAWCILAFFVYGSVFSTCNARWHESLHGTPFRTPLLNNIAFFVCATMEYKDMVSARWIHLNHHVNTIIIGKDLEVLAPRPVRLGIILLDYFYLHFAVLSLWVLLLHTLGIPSRGARLTVPKEKHIRMFWASRATLVIQLAAIALAVGLQSWLPILLFTVPRIYGGVMVWIFVVAQHSGLAENVWDHRLSTRSIRVNPILSFFYMHMENHLEHHLYPNVPFQALPRLAELIKPWMPRRYTSLWDVYREMWPTLLRQRRDTDYFIRRELPG